MKVMRAMRAMKVGSSGAKPVSVVKTSGMKSMKAKATSVRGGVAKSSVGDDMKLLADELAGSAAEESSPESESPPGSDDEHESEEASDASEGIQKKPASKKRPAAEIVESSTRDRGKQAQMEKHWDDLPEWAQKAWKETSVSKMKTSKQTKFVNNLFRKNKHGTYELTLQNPHFTEIREKYDESFGSDKKKGLPRTLFEGEVRQRRCHNCDHEERGYRRE